MSYEHPQSPPPSSADQTRTLGDAGAPRRDPRLLLRRLGRRAGHLAGQPREGRAAADEARVALNFQLTVLIGLIICTVVRQIPGIGFIGWLGFIAVSIISLVLSILAAVAVQRGGSYRYPFSLRARARR